MWPFLVSMFERADALLLGRKTWEIWLPYWPNHDDDPLGHAINALPKYVPSTTLKDPTWQHTHVISGDLEPAIRELKAKPGGELQLHGSGELLRWLLERDLVDELNLRIYPVIVGDGIRLFPEHGQSHGLEVIDRGRPRRACGSRPIDRRVARPSGMPAELYSKARTRRGRFPPPRSGTPSKGRRQGLAHPPVDAFGSRSAGRSRPQAIEVFAVVLGAGLADPLRRRSRRVMQAE